MKITSSRVDDLRKARDEWESGYNARKEEYRAQRQRYHQAVYDVTHPIEEKLLADLAKYNLLDFDVEAREDQDWESAGDGLTSYVSISIRCNDSRVHDETSALSWDYKVRLIGGQLVQESGSWSGLNATTEENLRSLEQTLEALKYLAAVDWETLIHTELPDSNDYVTISPRGDDRPDFENQIKEAAVEEIIGKPILIKGRNIESVTGRSRGNCWYRIHRETPKKYIISYITEFELDAWDTDEDKIAYVVNNSNPWTVQIKKEYLLRAIIEPIETIGN